VFSIFLPTNMRPTVVLGGNTPNATANRLPVASTNRLRNSDPDESKNQLRAREG